MYVKANPHNAIVKLAHSHPKREFGQSAGIFFQRNSPHVQHTGTNFGILQCQIAWVRLVFTLFHASVKHWDVFVNKADKDAGLSLADSWGYDKETGGLLVSQHRVQIDIQHCFLIIVIYFTEQWLFFFFFAKPALSSWVVLVQSQAQTHTQRLAGSQVGSLNQFVCRLR